MKHCDTRIARYVAPPCVRQRGFSLVEVMVALVVISVGLLGIAKMQALAMASTGSARERSIAALEAASLAATMHADRGYWSAVTADPAVTVTNGVVTATATGLGSAGARTDQCRVAGSTCTTLEIAAVDLKEWAASTFQQLGPSTATVACSIASATTPVSCVVTISWTENLVQLNAATNVSASASSVSSALTSVANTQYVLIVEP